MFKDPRECQRLALPTILKNAKEKHEKFVKEYESNPKLCKECGIPIPFEKRSNKFCGSSCSISHSNKNRKLTWKGNPVGFSKMAKPCKTCGKLTLKKSGFCSQKCYGRSVIKKHIDEGTGVGQDSLRRYLIFSAWT